MICTLSSAHWQQASKLTTLPNAVSSFLTKNSCIQKYPFLLLLLYYYYYHYYSHYYHRRPFPVMTRLQNLKKVYYVILPPEMSHMATRSFLGYSHFPKGGAIYRFRLFNEISFSSLFYVRKRHLLHTHEVYKCH